MSDTPMDGTYSDIDDMLCELCCLPFYQCIHAHMSQIRYDAASPFYVDPSVFLMPPLGFDQTQPDLAPIYNFVKAGQSLLSENVRVMDANETTVQPVTVQAHVEDTYNPGDRLATRRNRRTVHKRQAPCPGGFRCEKDDCNKTFDRKCDLK
ncbi:hypothetical protein J4E91_000965 [Alternaria rosae]|nr:hypothetical protein J4E91_000965 [Alternaria rosae]